MSAFLSQLSRSLSPKKEQPEFGIKELSCPEDPERCNFDIVFIHGLMGDRERTWTSEGGKLSWPAYLLPPEVPTARILTYGYGAEVFNLVGATSTSNTANHSQKLLAAIATFREKDNTNDRPIGFVCHSLGGLVCEDALVASKNSAETHLRRIEDCTRGVLFLGTPHHGSDLAQGMDWLTKSVSTVAKVNRSSLKVLKRDSEVLARIQDSFHAMVRVRNRASEERPPIEVTCFFEELETHGRLIVPQSSAVLPGYNSIGIRKDHRNMGKFDNEDDEGFKAVAGEIRRWVNRIPDTRVGDDPQSPGAKNTTPSPPPPQPSQRVFTQGAQFSHITFNGSVTGGKVGNNSGTVYGGMNF